MRKSLANKRARYYELIWKYKQRRDIIRKRLGHNGPEYNKAAASINKKIKLWGRQIKKYDMISNKIMTLGNMVAYFTGHNVKDSATRYNKTKDPCWIARAIFYKYGIENLKLEQKLLREYIGAKRITQPAEYRKAFNKFLREVNDMRVMWKNFKRYYEEFPVEGNNYLDKRTVTQ